VRPYYQKPVTEQLMAPQHPKDGGNEAGDPLNLHRPAEPGLLCKPLAKTVKTFFRSALALLKARQDQFGFRASGTEALSAPGAVNRSKEIFPAFGLLPVHAAPIGSRSVFGFHECLENLGGIHINPPLCVR